ncbi:MAG: hypothetical protein AAFU71_12015 [Cyanobacteria bacterium J06632_22]
MALDIEVFEAAGNSTAAGVFIPVSDLPGIDAAELAAGETDGAKQGKTLLAMVSATLTAITAASPLGLTLTQGNNSNAGPNLIGLNFTLSWDKLADIGGDTISVIPLPTAGANAGNGGLGIVDAFPNAAKVAAAGAVPGAGVVINDTAVATYGAAAPTVAAGEDNRKWFAGLFDHLADADVREAGVTQSAVTAAARGAIGSAAIPANFTATVDPLSDISEADLPQLGLLTRSATLQIQVELNQSTQSFDVVVS